MTSRQPSRQASRQPTPGVPEEEEETYTVQLPPERTFERQAWDQLVVGEWNVRPNEPAELTESGLRRWEAFRDRYVAEENQKLALAAARRGKKPEQTMSTSAEMSTTDQNKLFRQIVSDPGDFDGDRSKFEAWWNNMQIYLMGYTGVNDIAKVMAVLTRLKFGEAEAWARVKKQNIIETAGADWREFSQELQERFDDVSKVQKARNDIHNFHQDRKSTNAYLDQFEILKSVTKTTDDTAYYLLTRGISSNVLNRLYGSKEKVPDTYKELVPAIRAIGQNIDIIHGLRQSVTNPERRQSAFADTCVHSGVIHGGSGKPMEIDKVTGVCYNCGKEGHFSNKCKQPKKSAPDKTNAKCFNCGRTGHFSKECKATKKNGRKPSKGHFKNKGGKFKKKKRMKKCEEGDQEDDSEGYESDDESDEQNDKLSSIEEAEEEDFQE